MASLTTYSIKTKIYYHQNWTNKTLLIEWRASHCICQTQSLVGKLQLLRENRVLKVSKIVYMIETKCKIEFTAKMWPISTSSKTCKQFLIISELCKGCNKLTKLIICLKAVLTIVITFQSSLIRKLNQQLVWKMLQSYHLRIVFSCVDVLEIT